MLSYDVFLFAFGITTPIFIVLLVGALLKQRQVVDDAFIATSSKLVFNIALPALLFVNIVDADINLGQSLGLVAFGLAATLVIFILLELTTPWFIHPAGDRGVVIQGSFRANMGIIGLAYCVSAYGSQAFSLASLYLAVVTIAFNVLSVTTLIRWRGDDTSARGQLGNVLTSIAKNPLIIAISCALIANFTGIPLPDVLLQAGHYFAQITLPLALLCAGASLNIQRDNNLANALITTALKLVVIPLVMVVSAVQLGFRGMELGILFLMCSAPSASVSYVMARAMGGNATLAANIIVITTLLSLFSTSLGIIILRSYNLI